MKKWQKILIIVVVALVALSIIKNFVIKTAITSIGSSVLGAPLTIGHFSLGIVAQKVKIKNLRVYNPPGFPSEPMVDIPEAGVHFDVFALLGGKLHLPYIVFNLKEMVVVKDKNGKLNVDALKIFEEKSKDPKKDEKPDAKEGKAPAMQIDVMKLNIGRVIMKDYTKGDEPSILVYEVDLKDKTFKNITSPQELATVVMVQGLGPTALKGAKAYAAATLLGVGFLPAGVAGVFMGKDHATQVFSQSTERLYQTSLEVLGKIGQVTEENKTLKEIKGKVDGADITIKIVQSPEHKTDVTVAARKMMIPKPELAGGVLYQIAEKL
jgi:hypothetical protein